MNLFLPCLICVLPLVLFFDLTTGFDFDWNNHIWIIAYFGKYLSANLAFPKVLNTLQGLGVPQPLFYGYFFFPVSGILSAVIGAGNTIRILSFTVLMLQFNSVCKLFYCWKKEKIQGIVVATLTVWTIYPLTNLYNRSALPEFFATSLLISCACYWLIIVHRIQSHPVWQEGVTFCLLFVLMLGTHPITAVFGSLVLVILALGSLTMVNNKVQLFKYALIVFIICTLALSPWLYANAFFSPHILIKTDFRVVHLPYLDHIFTRILPFPYDFRSILSGISDVSTPYLDAQINMPLFFLCLVVFFWNLKKNDLRLLECKTLLYISALGFIFFLWSSVDQSVWIHLPSKLKIIQFKYRTITYVNFFLFLIAFCLTPIQNKSTVSISKAILWTICLTTAFLNVGLKLIHAYSIETPQTSAGSFPTDLNSLASQPQRLASHDYLTHNRFSPVTVGPYLNISVPLEVQKNFGKTAFASISLLQNTTVVTNVKSFTWNSLVVNGRTINIKEILLQNDNLAVRLPAGQYKIGYEFNPDVSWTFLYRLSFSILFLLFFLNMLFRVPSFVFIPIQRKKTGSGFIAHTQKDSS